MTGFKITSGDRAKLLMNVEGYTNNAAKIIASTSGNCLIAAIKLCVVYANYENFFASESVGNKLDDNHAWMSGEG